MIGRSIALLVLALQLQPAGLPLVCEASRASQSAECDQPMSPAHAGPVLAAPQGHGLCVNPAFCGLPQAATPTSVVSVASVTESRDGVQRPRPSVHAIEAPAPLPPPPEA